MKVWEEEEREEEKNRHQGEGEFESMGKWGEEKRKKTNAKMEENQDKVSW